MSQDFTFSRTTVEQTLRDLRSGASNDFVEQFFADDPEMLAWVQQQHQTNGQASDSQASVSEKQPVQV